MFKLFGELCLKFKRFFTRVTKPNRINRSYFINFEISNNKLPPMGNQTGGAVPPPPPSASLPPGAKPLSKTLQDRFKGNNKGMTYDSLVSISTHYGC